MQLKATKLAALVLFTSLGLAFAAPLAASAGQWVRFTITKKGNTTDELCELTQFCVFDAAGNCLNLNFTRNTSICPPQGSSTIYNMTDNPPYRYKTSAESLAPLEFAYYAGRFNMSGTTDKSVNLFKNDSTKWESTNIKSLGSGEQQCHQEFTMRLADDAAPVVKYNLRSGNSVSSYPGRAPTCWVVETSDNGIDWVVRDEQNNQATSGYTTSNNTWYNGGGSGNDPTTFYRLNRESPEPSAGSELPSGYTQLDWIKSTRAQRIKTDYVPNAKTWMEVDFKLDGGWSYSPETSAALLSSDGTAGYSCHIGSDGGQYNRFIVYFNGKVDNSFKVDTYMLRHTLRLESGVLTWGSENPSCTARTVDCNDALYLFGRKDYNFNMYNMTVYSWKIYESDDGTMSGANKTLVHDFVPALDPDGVPGLYDTEGHKFYSSITETDFVYYYRGSLPADYTRLEYIESTVDGKQYIDVPYVKFVTDKATQITIRGMYTATASDSQTFCGFTSAGCCWLGLNKNNSNDLGNDITDSQTHIPFKFTSPANSLDAITWTIDPRNSDKQRQGWLAVDSAQNGQGSATIDSKPSLDVVLRGEPLSIFATHDYYQHSGDPAFFSNYKLYAMTVEQGGVVVADFVPALNSEGVPGLYDLANGQFLTNDGSGEFGTKTAEQWFRLSITQVKPDASYKALQFSEFALYDVAGSRQNLGLSKADDATNVSDIQPGYYQHVGSAAESASESTAKTLDGNLDTKIWLGVSMDSDGKLANKQVLTMHLTNGAPEVVKYNFCTAKDWGGRLSPLAWTLERSYDGYVWDVVDAQTEATSMWPNAVKAWYKNGGTGNAPSAYFFFGDSGKQTTQWFRLTIKKKADRKGEEQSDKSLQLSEFALYDVNGVRQNLNLSQGESAEGLWPGEFYYDSKVSVSFSGLPPLKLFDGKVSSEGDKMYIDFNTSDLSGLCDGDELCWQVLTMRLANGAPEVVKYNMCSGNDTASHTSRAPTAWTLEKSYDGVNWVVCDVQVEATSGYTTANSTWYRDGGTDTEPTTFYMAAMIPLPKLGQTVYSYTGAPISPRMMEASQFYTLGGDTIATNEGTYKIVCTLKPGCKWANGSTGPYELEWQIVPESFLQRVANDPNRVDNKPGYDNQYASGGDIVLQIGNEYVHVFTNGTDRTFTANTELANARLLLVGGGGSGGLRYSGCSGAGGGAGGMVVVDGYQLVIGDYRVDVGSGARSSTSIWEQDSSRAYHPQGYNGGDSVLTKTDGVEELFKAIGGGGGGSSGLQGNNVSWPLGYSGGSGGGHAGVATAYTPHSGLSTVATGVTGQGYAGGMNVINAQSSIASAGGGGAGGTGEGCTTTSTWANGGAGGIGRSSDILGWSAFFAGGGAGGSANSYASIPASGGVGGGGSTRLHADFADDDATKLIMNGMDGLGGGGAGAPSGGTTPEILAGRGGSGIVIIRYQIPNTTLQATPPVAKTGLVYNGKTQVGVPEGVGYTLSEMYYYATEAGTYTTTATLLPGYEWNDAGDKTAPREIVWSISMLNIALDANGGTTAPNPATVTVTPGQAMPQLEDGQILIGTRTGYTFQGYSAEGWIVTPMTGEETDIINEGTGLFAYSAGGMSYTVNGVQFEYKFAKDATTFTKDGQPTMTFSEKIKASDGGSGPGSHSELTTGYYNMLNYKMYVEPGKDLKVTLSGLMPGHSYLVQLVCNESVNGYEVFGLNVGGVSYECSSKSYGPINNPPSDSNLKNVPYGRSFVYRFEADSATHDFCVNRYGPYGDGTKYGSFVQINAMQLRDVTESEGSLKYYNADGSSARTYPAENGPTELFAIWTRALPPEFEPLDCLDNGSDIATAGFVQIDGFRLAGSNVVELKYNVNAEKENGYQDIFMARAYLDGQTNLDNLAEFGLGRNTVANPAQLSFTYGKRKDPTSNVVKVNNGGAMETGVDVVARLCSSNEECLFGGVQLTGTDFPDAYTEALPCDLFIFSSADYNECNDYAHAGHANDPSLHSVALVKMYYFKVMASATDPTLLLDLIPAKRTRDEVEGFYDLVGGGFYPLYRPCANATVADGHTVTEWHNLSATETTCGYECGVCTKCRMRISKMIPAIKGASVWHWDGESHKPAITGTNDWWGVAGCAVAYNPNTDWTGMENPFTATFTLMNEYVWTDGTTANVVYNYTCLDPEFHVMRADGPTIEVKKTDWLDRVYGDDKTYETYQKALFETNASGVVAWQAYILGFGATKTAVDGAAIVEETVQNASPDTVTIRLKDMPEKPRTNATTRLAYSLLSATTPGGLANGGGTVVTNASECVDGYYKWSKSTFEAPLKDLSDLEPVRYYRIKVHFIFGEGK